MLHLQRCFRSFVIEIPLRHYPTIPSILPSIYQDLTFKVISRRTISTGCLQCASAQSHHERLGVESRQPVKPALYVQDEEWAARTVREVLQDHNESGQPMCNVWLTNPGDSVMTQLFLQHCAVTAWEPRKIFTEYFKSLSSYNSSKFRYIQKAFLGPLSVQSSNVQPVDNQSDRIAVVGNVPLMQDYVNKLLRGTTSDLGSVWAPEGRVRHFLFLTQLDYRLMTETDSMLSRRYYQRSCLYRLFLQSNLIFKIPATAFNRRPTFNTNLRNEHFDADHLYFVRMSVKSDVFENVCRAHEIQGFVKLLKIVTSKRKQRVIPLLEQLCPDVGPALIDLDVSMLTVCQDVPLSLWYNIYQVLVSSPHYEYSAMKMLLESDTITTSRLIKKLNRKSSD